MGDDGALRMRRSRAHARDDHTLCRLETCESAGQGPSRPVTPPVTPPPAGLRERGARLWSDLATPDRTPGEMAVVDEAARLADRLDTMDALLRGDVDQWARLVPRDDGVEYVLVVDALLSQARMHASTLRTLVAELRASASARTPVAPAAGPATTTDEGGWLDDLAARRARRVADASGVPVP